MPTLNQRITYSEKYFDLQDKFGINKETVEAITRKYEMKLIDELASDEPWDLNKFFRDTRSDDEYLYDILDGQLIEDVLVEWFKERGHKVKKCGSDANGKIVRNGKAQITTNPDLLVDDELIEVQVSRQGFRDKYHIKKNKGDKILKGFNKLMFIVDDSYFVVDNEVLNEAVLINNPAWGGKECFEITNVDYLKLGGNYEN